MKIPKFEQVLGDGDCYLFRAGMAAQHNKYSIVPIDDYDQTLASSKDKKALEAMLHKEFDPEQHTIVGEVVPETLANAQSNLRLLIGSVLSACGCDDHTVFLSDPSGESYRKALDPQYKANRDPSNKPYWYNELRYYAMRKYHCQEATRGREADDLLGIAQYAAGDRTIIASVDKDLMQIPGWHYNIIHKKLLYVTPEEADLFVWHQMLIGDVADNIKGIYGVGPKKAEVLLAGCTPGQAEAIVRELYEKHKGPDWEDAFHINYQLLTILRSDS